MLVAGGLVVAECGWLLISKGSRRAIPRLARRTYEAFWRAVASYGGRL